MPLHRITFSACLILLLVTFLTSSPVNAGVQAAASPTPSPAGAGAQLSGSSLSAWHVSAALNQSRYLHAITAWQNVLYVAGGTDFDHCQGDIEYAIIQKDGVLAHWTPASIPPAEQAADLNLVRCSFKAVTSANNLYLLGGVNVLDITIPSVTMATVLPWGDLTAWQAARPLPGPRANFGAAAANGFIYVAGGADGTAASPLKSVLYARVLPDGTLDNWITAEPLRTGRSGLELVAAGGYLYAIGGNNGSGGANTVEYAQIQADGSLTPWQNTSGLNIARTDFGATSDGEYLYVMGGSVGKANDSSNSVEFAQINRDHSLTRWRTAKNNLLQDKTGPAAVAVNGYLYVTGGMAYDNSFHTTEYTQALGKGPALTATAQPSPTPTATLPPSATPTITLTPTPTPTSTVTPTFDPFLIYTQAAQTVQAAVAQAALTQTAQAAVTSTPAPTDTLAPTGTATVEPSPTPTPTPTVTDTFQPTPTITALPTAISGEQIQKALFHQWFPLGLALLVLISVYLFLRVKFRGRRLVINLSGRQKDHHRTLPGR